MTKGQEDGTPKLYCEYRGPGPLAYKLKPLTGRVDHDTTKVKAPAYSISLPILHRGASGPGPSDYTVKDTLTSKGTQDPAPVTLKGRTKLPALKDCGPAPGAYDVTGHNKLSTKRSHPAPRIGYRYELPDYRCGPGPTAYSLPDKVGSSGTGTSKLKKTPTWTFKSRTDHGSVYWEGKTKNNPSPSSYKCPEPSVYKKSFGSFSIQGRTQRPVYNTALQNPAPGAYNAYQGMGQSGKGHTMGTRHSKNVLVCLTMADTVY